MTPAAAALIARMTHDSDTVFGPMPDDEFVRRLMDIEKQARDDLRKVAQAVVDEYASWPSEALPSHIDALRAALRESGSWGDTSHYPEIDEPEVPSGGPD